MKTSLKGRTKINQRQSTDRPLFKNSVLPGKQSGLVVVRRKRRRVYKKFRQSRTGSEGNKQTKRPLFKSASFPGKYLDLIKERGAKSKVYKKYQSTGLALSEILADPGHKSLYIRLAKTQNEDKLLSLAKDVSGRENVKNKGAYFMRLLQESKLASKK